MYHHIIHVFKVHFSHIFFLVQARLQRAFHYRRRTKWDFGKDLCRVWFLRWWALPSRQGLRVHNENDEKRMLVLYRSYRKGKASKLTFPTNLIIGKTISFHFRTISFFFSLKSAFYIQFFMQKAYFFLGFDIKIYTILHEYNLWSSLYSYFSKPSEKVFLFSNQTDPQN